MIIAATVITRHDQRLDQLRWFVIVVCLYAGFRNSWGLSFSFACPPTDHH